jgi:hypothetical protein
VAQDHDNRRVLGRPDTFRRITASLFGVEDKP